MGRKRATSARRINDTYRDNPEVSFFGDNVIDLPTSKPRSTFKRLTANHHRLVHAIRNNPITLINGPAGSLKTFLTLQTALAMIDQGSLDKLIYIRQNIQRPNEKDKGAYPGERADKLSPLLKPIRDNLEAILTPYELAFLLDNGKIEATDIEDLRGRSPLRSFLFCDEAQNCDLTSLETVMTRRTECSVLALAGDYKAQRDIFTRDFDGYELVCNEFKDKFAYIQLNKNDILRSETNKDVITGFENIKAKLTNQPF